MTSTPGTHGSAQVHPEVSEISAFSEGILSPEQSAQLRDHLAACELCADVRDSLDEIRGLLGTLPGVPRMPDDVARRIDAALAAEALVNASTPESSKAAEGRPGDRGARVSRETAPAADRPAGHAPSATGPGRGRPKRRRVRVVLAAACTAAVLGLGGILVTSLGSSGSGGDVAGSPHPAQVGTFSGTQLPTRVHQLLGAAGSASSMKPNAHVGQNTPFATQATPPVPGCVLKATGRSDTPIAFTRGSYDGHSSYLLVLPHPADPSHVDAYVVDAACESASPSGKGAVLAEQTYRR
ncbi:zf-HC2 domain-containing protein [Streptantibioticus parmotrematis]|uniref:anti-sigma factor family protein n=1 Tax=Streptantibioticus parmotrematis TaxID=2873249 RepID=UPI0033F82D3C